MDAILKSLKDLSENDPYYLGVETILLSYDPSKSSTENIKNLESNYTKDQLTAAVYFSKSLETDYPAIVKRINQRKSRNKPQLAGDIAILISGVTPIRCEECKQEYIHPAAENTQDNQVSCLLCNRSSHKPCYLNQNEIKTGYHFICTVCSTNYKDKSHNESDKVTETTQSTESNQNEDDAESDTSSIINSHQTPNHKQSREGVEKDEKWCRMYLEGVCPHGISGRGCSYTHPKRCNKYSRHGDDKWRGCWRGRKCKYFHPRICRNSAELRMCLTKTCKDVHLVGTRRFKPRNRNESFNAQENHQSTSQRRSYRHQENHISPWQDPQPSTHNTEDQINDAQRTQNFLVQYLENMKADLTKTMERKIESVLMQERRPAENHQLDLPQPAKTTQGESQPPNPSNHQKSPQPQLPIPTNHQKSPPPQDIPLNLLSQPNSFQPPPNLPTPLPQVQLQNLLHPQFPLSQNPFPHIYM